MHIKDCTKQTDLRWLNLFEVAYLDKHGRQRRWQVASRAAKPKCVTGLFDPPDAVIIVALHVASGALVMTREYRVPLADFEYGFPAGLVDEGEGIKDAVRRELWEETGLAVERFVRIGPAVYSSAGMTDESVAMVYVECSGQPSTRGNTASENIDVLLVGPAEAARLCADASLKFDAKAWLVASTFGRYGEV